MRGVSIAIVLSGVFCGELKNASSVEVVSASNSPLALVEKKNERVPSTGSNVLCPGLGGGPAGFLPGWSCSSVLLAGSDGIYGSSWGS